MQKLFGLLVVVSLLWWLFFSGPSSVTLGPGVLAPEPPRQTTVQSEPFEHDKYLISKVANFEVKAKVLARKDYRFGREADLSPTDLVLGWGNMSDEQVLSHIDISQSNRFYFWRVESFPIPRREIETSSANMHLIPGNYLVEQALAAARPGQLIELSGSLVNVTDQSKQWRWRSSLSRDDTGKGACELIWVNRLRLIDP